MMKKWSTTHRQPIGVPCCQRSPTTPDVVTKKNSTNMLFTPKARLKETRKRPPASAAFLNLVRFWPARQLCISYLELVHFLNENGGKTALRAPQRPAELHKLNKNKPLS